MQRHLLCSLGDDGVLEVIALARLVVDRVEAVHPQRTVNAACHRQLFVHTHTYIL
jgi:hypothetical protein